MSNSAVVNDSARLVVENGKKHIYFENQQEERLAFHGYHLQPGEENYDNIDMDQLTLLKT